MGVLEALAATAEITWGRSEEDWREMTLLHGPLFPGQTLQAWSSKACCCFVRSEAIWKMPSCQLYFLALWGYSVVAHR